MENGKVYKCNSKDEILAALDKVEYGDIIRCGKFQFTPNEIAGNIILLKSGKYTETGKTGNQLIQNKIKRQPGKLWKF